MQKRLEQQDLRDDEDDDEDLEAVLDLANELMKSKSDDVELLRRWLESERKTQQRLVDLLFSADRNLSVVLVRRLIGMSVAIYETSLTLPCASTAH